MADLEVRLDDRVVRVLRIRAAKRGVSLEEEVRTILGGAVAAPRDAFRRRTAALRRATATGQTLGTDSARTIREDRDAMG